MPTRLKSNVVLDKIETPLSVKKSFVQVKAPLFYYFVLIFSAIGLLWNLKDFNKLSIYYMFPLAATLYGGRVVTYTILFLAFIFKRKWALLFAKVALVPNVLVSIIFWLNFRFSYYSVSNGIRREISFGLKESIGLSIMILIYAFILYKFLKRKNIISFFASKNV